MASRKTPPKNETVVANEMDEAKLSQSRAEQLKVIATLSHELRTPLHAIMGLSELLLSEQMSPTAQRHVDKINVASQGLLDSLNKAIEAARSETGSVVINPTTTDITGLIEKTIRTFSIAAEGKGIELALMIDPKLFKLNVEVDAVHLQQVLNNLIGNSIKFTDSGSIEVWVAVKGQVDSEVEIYFSVIDTGIGIEQKDIKRVLSPFGQVIDAQKGRPLGSGLGMGICVELLQKMGASLELKSEPGKGTKASFKLRLSISKTLPQKPAIKFISNPVIAIVAAKSVRFEIIETFLRDWGARVFRIQSLKQLSIDKVDALVVSEQVSVQENHLCRDWTLKIPQGRMVVVRSENSAFPPGLVDRTDEMFEPLLPSALHDYFEKSGLTGSVSQQVKMNIENPSQKWILKVLAVDDSMTNLILLKSQLMKIGNVEVVLAKNGAEALNRLVSDEEFHLVLMDFNMPILDGPSATKQLRDQGYDLPIIGLTALDSESIELTNSSHLFNEILNKPAGMSAIEAVLNNVRLNKYHSIVTDSEQKHYV